MTRRFIALILSSGLLIDPVTAHAFNVRGSQLSADTPQTSSGSLFSSEALNLASVYIHPWHVKPAARLYAAAGAILVALPAAAAQWGWRPILLTVSFLPAALGHILAPGRPSPKRNLSAADLQRRGFTRNLTPAAVRGDGTAFGERLFLKIERPEIVFNAWLIDTQAYQSRLGSHVMTVEDNAVLGRLAAFYMGNLMLAFINQRKRDYGVGWVSIVRNFGSTVQEQFAIWETDPAFANFPWENVILMGGDNYIHGVGAAPSAPGPAGSAEAFFVKHFKLLAERGLRPENTWVIQGDFSTAEGLYAFLVPNRLQRLIQRLSGRLFPSSSRGRLPAPLCRLLVLMDGRIASHIEAYLDFVPNHIRKIQTERRLHGIVKDELLPGPSVDIMQMGLSQGPDESVYYRLISWGERFPLLQPLTWRIAACTASVHLWFDEMVISSHSSRMRVVPLNPATVKVNKRKYGQEKGYWWAITLGLGNVQDLARYNVVFGNRGKETTLDMIFAGPISRFMPVSVLRRVADKTLFFAVRAPVGSLSSDTAGGLTHLEVSPSAQPPRVRISALLRAA